MPSILEPSGSECNVICELFMKQFGGTAFNRPAYLVNLERGDLRHMLKQ